MLTYANLAKQRQLKKGKLKDDLCDSKWTKEWTQNTTVNLVFLLTSYWKYEYAPLIAVQCQYISLER